jgi:hypothetical protein
VSAARTLFGALGLADLSTGCVLLMTDTISGSACTFAGAQSTDCGRCIASACQGKVNACCRADCAKTLDHLDRCTATGECNEVLGKQATLAGDELAACARGSCESVCGSGAGGVSADGGTAVPEGGSGLAIACTESGESCSCTAQTGTGTSGPRCTPSALDASTPRAVCCATRGWPVAGGECTCGAFHCAPNAFSGCECEVAPQTVNQPDDSLSGCSKGSPSYEWMCCAKAGQGCYCAHKYTGSCPGGWSVTSNDCTVGGLACPSGQEKVTRCTP